MEPLLEEWGPLLVEQLREQLNNLTAAAQLLTPVVQESGEERHRQYLAILNQSVYRMTRTLNNAEYAQLPEGEPALRRAPLDLAGLCRELERQGTPALPRTAAARDRCPPRALVLEQREGRGLRSVVSLPVCPPERNQMLKTPQMGCDPTGGFSPVLVELSGVLPYQAFLPEDVE